VRNADHVLALRGRESAGIEANRNWLLEAVTSGSCGWHPEAGLEAIEPTLPRQRPGHGSADAGSWASVRIEKILNNLRAGVEPLRSFLPARPWNSPSAGRWTASARWRKAIDAKIDRGGRQGAEQLIRGRCPVRLSSPRAAGQSQWVVTPPLPGSPRLGRGRRSRSWRHPTIASPPLSLRASTLKQHQVKTLQPRREIRAPQAWSGRLSQVRLAQRRLAMASMIQRPSRFVHRPLPMPALPTPVHPFQTPDLRGLCAGIPDFQAPGILFGSDALMRIRGLG